MTNRYDTTENSEGQYQLGSQDLVLLNKLGITDPQEMEGIEFDHLIQFQVALFDELTVDQQLTTNDLCEWHRRWLGEIYQWAGNYRTVTTASRLRLFHNYQHLWKNLNSNILKVHAM